LIRRPLAVCAEDRYAILLPDTVSRITVEVDAPAPPIERQICSVDLEHDLSQSLAPARDFCLADRLELLRKQGMARGANRRNLVVVKDRRVVDPEGLRFPDELARHGILDCVGDLVLMGAALRGHLFAYRPEHGLIQALARKLFAYQATWSYGPAPPFEERARGTAARARERIETAERRGIRCRSQ
jgi:UDP-3-O-[3-hydroxymyristoyl] N-acetylglucosamine deacetylase